MAHFAKIENNIVTQVIVVGDEYETIYAQSRLEHNEIYVQTSYNAATNGFRKNYAGVGYSYDQSRDAFIAPQCHDVAILDESTCRWTCEDASHNVPS